MNVDPETGLMLLQAKGCQLLEGGTDKKHLIVQHPQGQFGSANNLVLN